MRDQDRLEFILAQARIAKAALAAPITTASDIERTKLDQAILAIEAIVLLADSEFHSAQAAE